MLVLKLTILRFVSLRIGKKKVLLAGTGRYDGYESPFIYA